MSPASLKGLVAHPSYASELSAAVDLFGSSPGRWRVLYHNDGDGIASASVAALTLSRLGRGWQLTPLLGVERAGVERVLRSTKGPLLVVDTGASFLDLFAAHGRPVVVLDHHTPPPPESRPSAPTLAFVDPHDWGVDGMTDLSASTLTYLFARHLLPDALDLVPFALSGAVADRMHVGGFRGPNKVIVEEAEAAGVLRRARRVNLSGSTLEEALAASLDPYFVGISGRLGAARSFLSGLGLSPSAPPSSLSEEESRKLTSALLARLVAQGTRPEFCERVQEEFLRTGGQGWEVHELSRLQNAAGREGEPSLGVALALGDEEAHRRTRKLEAQWQTGVLDGLRAIEETGTLHGEGRLRWFETSQVNLGGTLAGLALTYFTDPTRPLFSFSPKGDDVKVSSRGTLWLTDHGLDLSRVCREAAEKVHGEGGGHRVASGATIPRGSEAEFLEEADRILAGQLSGLSEKLPGFRPASSS